METSPSAGRYFLYCAHNKISHFSFNITSTDLLLSHEDLVHIGQRYRVPVLVIVESHSNLVEKELNIEARRVAVHAVIYDNLKVTR